MTLSLKIKHNGPACYAAQISRDNVLVGRLDKLGDEVEVYVWKGSSLSVEECEPKKEEPATVEAS
jgi:hypothetical protein